MKRCSQARGARWQMLEILQIADPDAQANYRILLKFRDRLLAAPTLEAAYTGLFKGNGVDVPPLFVFQLTQIFLRHILGADGDPLEARMAECLFRVQNSRAGGRCGDGSR